MYVCISQSKHVHVHVQEFNAVFFPSFSPSFPSFHPPSFPSSLPHFLSISASFSPSPNSFLPADVSVHRKQLRCSSTNAMEREQMPLFKRFWRWLHDLDDLERLDTSVRRGNVYTCVHACVFSVDYSRCTILCIYMSKQGK